MRLKKTVCVKELILHSWGFPGKILRSCQILVDILGQQTISGYFESGTCSCLGLSKLLITKCFTLCQP